MSGDWLRILAVFGVCLAIAPSTKGQAEAQVVHAPEAEQATKLTALFELLESNDKFMGTVAVAKNGETIFEHQYGKIAVDATAGQTPNAETQYRVGSITKTFTAVMVLQLIEEEKLSLDSKLAEFFPELKNAAQISILQLLGHQSGIGSITDDPTYRSWRQSSMAREKMLKIIAGQPTKFGPGEKSEYSNSNYVLLGYIVEKLTNSTYAQQLQTRICLPIGLKRTSFMAPADAGKNIAISFRFNGKQWDAAEQTDASIPHGAGSVMSTAGDLIRFAEALFAGKLVSEASVNTMKPSGLGMGNGLFGSPFGRKRGLGHNGGIDGFQSALGHFEQDDVTVAVIGNGVNYSLNEIMIGILSFVFDQPYELPSFVRRDVSDKVLQQYVGTYTKKNFSLKVTITVKDGELVAQGSGQPSFGLGATSETEFRSEAVGVAIVFSQSSPDGDFDTMMLKQGGQKLEFRKE